MNDGAITEVESRASQTLSTVPAAL
jgi:hypothetical protein